MTRSINGVLIIDKPSGLTSHDVVHRVRRIVGQRDVGHLGTLDPLATGILPLVLGNMTRLAQFYLKSDKCYEGVIRFGFATDTYDAEGEQTGEARPFSHSLDELRALAGKFASHPAHTCARWRTISASLLGVVRTFSRCVVRRLQNSRSKTHTRSSSFRLLCRAGNWKLRSSILASFCRPCLR